MAVDAGLVNDRTALCVVHNEGNCVVLDRLDCWQGTHANRISIDRIELWIREVLKNFHHVAQIVLDVYQLEQVAQKFERYGVERFNFGGGAHYKLAENLRTLIINKRFRIYPRAGEIRLANGKTEDLVDEMSALVVVEKNGGLQYRLDHQPGLHDDRTICCGMACLAAAQMHKSIDPLPYLEALNRKPKLFGDMEMDYLQVKKVQAYGTYQICPVVKGQEIRLLDYNTKDEAAWACNWVHTYLGSEPPNVLDASRVPNAQRQHEIQTALLGELDRRRIAPPKHARRETAKD